MMSHPSIMAGGMARRCISVGDMKPRSLRARSIGDGTPSSSHSSIRNTGSSLRGESMMGREDTRLADDLRWSESPSDSSPLSTSFNRFLPCLPPLALLLHSSGAMADDVILLDTCCQMLYLAWPAVWLRLASLTPVPSTYSHGCARLHRSLYWSLLAGCMEADPQHITEMPCLQGEYSRSQTDNDIVVCTP